ncbi:MAG: hypothetical protein KBC35_03275 [Candidatus Pacebacteria bacterium]|nr:hypothetical protein [Candidatus Paceibacterota bacterium]
MHNIIMRRVYYSYGLSILSHAMFWRGVFLGSATLLLGQWLHVASIIHNFLSVPVESTPSYIWNSFWSAATHGEFLTVLTLVLAGGVAVSAGYHFTQALMSRLFVVRAV